MKRDMQLLEKKRVDLNQSSSLPQRCLTYGGWGGARVAACSQPICVGPSSACASFWPSTPWGSWSSLSLSSHPQGPIWGHRYHFTTERLNLKWSSRGQNQLQLKPLHKTQSPAFPRDRLTFIHHFHPALSSSASFLLGPFPFLCQWHVFFVSLGLTPAEYRIIES